MEFNNAIHVANRWGTIPIFGSIIGVARFTLSSTVSLITLIALGVLAVFTCSINKPLKETLRFSAQQMAFSLFEMIPFLGTLTHIRLKDSENIYFSLGYEEPIFLEETNFPSLSLLKTIALANVLGTIPGIGSVVGVLRFTCALLVTLIAITILGIKIAATGEQSAILDRLIILGLRHALLGIAEMIPLLGTAIHCRLAHIDKDNFPNISFSHKFEVINDYGLQNAV